MVQAAAIKEVHLRDYFEADPQRASQWAIDAPQVYVNYSRQRLSPPTLALLLSLAKVRGVPASIQSLFQGNCVNKTQQLPAMHTAFRAQPSLALIDLEQSKFLAFADALRLGLCGATGQSITDWVHIGIGGSHLGPELSYEALKPYHNSSIRVHFVANIDEAVLFPLLKGLDPEKTFLCIASKSFNSLETLGNAKTALAWLKNTVPHQWQKHVYAITERKQAAQDFGLLPDNIFTMLEGLGGRFSVWSAMGLPLAIAIGSAQFREMLAGAAQMDQHFKEAKLSENAPVILALISFWNSCFLGAQTHAILPYSHLLRHFPTYLQQLEMESNGKERCLAPVIFGQEGANGQHAFHQLLHQGGLLIPSDLIVVAKSREENGEQHRILLADALSQIHTLSFGTESLDPSDPEYCKGNQPCTALILQTLDPRTVGALLALYEHKVYVFGVLLGINSFDQPGVEQGKKRALAWLPMINSMMNNAFPEVLVPLVEQLKRER